ncbi:MAG: efflux RND transporter periplasmic adaptor subunit [Holophaga sp.]|nr:efflux RND transporter periplasmic adaptor subunit [Holophaga sp.]
MKRNRWLLLGGVLVVLALGGIAAARRKTGMPVQVAVAARQDLQAKVSANGKIQAVKKVDITANSIGQVTRMMVKEGDPVRTGELLLEIDPIQSRAAAQSREANLKATTHDLATAEAKLDKTRKDYARAVLNHQARIISQSDFEQAKANLDMDESAVRSDRQHVDQARADLAGATDVLDKTRITSPMTGMVTGKHIELGETAVPGLQNQPGTVLLTVSDMSRVEAEMEVDEASIPMVKLGQSAQVRIDAYPNQAFDGLVTEVGGSPIVQANSNEAIKFKVKVQLRQPPAGIKPGLSAQADIFTGSRSQVLAVPIQALVVKDLKAKPGEPAAPREQEGVYVMEAGRAVFRPLRTGLMGDLMVEVLSGLQGGEQVIIGPFKALRELKDRDPVRVDDRKKAD